MVGEGAALSQRRAPSAERHNAPADFLIWPSISSRPRQDGRQIDGARATSRLRDEDLTLCRPSESSSRRSERTVCDGNLHWEAAPLESLHLRHPLVVAANGSRKARWDRELILNVDNKSDRLLFKLLFVRSARLGSNRLGFGGRDNDPLWVHRLSRELRRVWTKIRPLWESALEQLGRCLPARPADTEWQVARIAESIHYTFFTLI